MTRTRGAVGALIVILCALLTTPPAAAAPDALPYPEREDYRIKAIQPDSWPDRDSLSGNNTGGVAVNLLWSDWEPVARQAPCAPEETAYDNRCYRVPPAVDEEIRDWTARGLVVTGVAYGTPAWAREGKACSPVKADFDRFCTPRHAADYARFTGLLAHRYNGLRGHGRVADLVVMNE
ncbi:hypothetical protein, partial [Crossiella equi]